MTRTIARCTKSFGLSTKSFGLPRGQPRHLDQVFARTPVPLVLMDKHRRFVHGNTAVVSLRYPWAHTWSAERLAGLTQLVRDLEADHEVSALVITGDGERFSHQPTAPER